ncbi:hypothetical protein QE152_g1562 [Popillia japonica]|uniref:Uncharacterized protein n=1 Tax=Popillia japonica TaxID=7064 RepID=A0AAW1N6H8_POPJA
MAESSRDKYAEKMADLQKHVPFIETNKMAESSRDKYAEKMADLQKHVPFIETMITHLKSTQEKSREAHLKSTQEKSREAQLKKLESLLQMITDTNKRIRNGNMRYC